MSRPERAEATPEWTAPQSEQTGLVVSLLLGFIGESVRGRILR
jgi:hypothetical protein